MNRAMLFVAVSLLVVICVTFTGAYAHAQGPAADTSATNSFLGDSIRNCEHQVAMWGREERLAIAIAVFIFVSGAIISLFHRSEKKWAKTLILVLGAGSSILTAFNSKFIDADFRTLERAVADGNSDIRKMDLWAQIMADPHASQKDWQDAKDAFLNELAQFQIVSNGLTGTGAVHAQSNLGALMRVYAQSAQSTVPGWVQKPPQDSASLYFVGSASDSNPTSAKQSSLDDAYHNAVLALRSKAPTASDPALLALVKGSGVVRDSAVSYTASTGIYTGYTLLMLASQIQTIGVASLPSAISAQSPPTTFQQDGWQPADLTFNPTSGMFVLDSSGGVSRLVADKQAGPQIEKLFRLGASYGGTAVTANGESVFVASNSKIGCTVYRYSLATKAVSNRVLAAHERCIGIATSGNTVYVTLPDRKEIRYWDSWDASSPHIWSMAEISSPSNLVFDAVGHRLIVADVSGNAYAISVPDGKRRLLASNLGDVASLATSRFQIIAASGNKLLFIGRYENRGENPPAGLQSLTGGHIVGVAVDASDGLWFADYDKKLVVGPFPLS